MNRLYEELIQEEQRLQKLITVITYSIEKAPKGRLRISHNGKSVQYYYKPETCYLKQEESKQEESKQEESKQEESKQEESKQEESNKYQSNQNQLIQHHNALVQHNQISKQGKYIRKSDVKLAYDLAQRDYDLVLLKDVKKRLEYVQNILKYYSHNQIGQIYKNLNPDRRELVTPRVITDEEYAKAWRNVTYTGKPFEEGTALIYTNKGERVRSKSEKIIADMLQKRGVFYRYEAPVTLRKLGTVYPDFTILNVRERKEIYWEHFGMMDNKEYCENALRKIELYQQNGILLGNRLIITYETAKHPIETEMIERNIREYCLK